jgi:hypothetical protein
MLSIGGITYVDDWNSALAANPTQLGLNAAAVAAQLGVGIEINYEENSSPNLAGLRAFINAYRSRLPYDATGANPGRAADHRRGCRRSLADRSRSQGHRRLAAHRPARAGLRQRHGAGAPAVERHRRREQLAGTHRRQAQLLAADPATRPGEVHRRPVHRRRQQGPAECTDFATSLQNYTGTYVQTAAPNGAGTTPGLLGYMFWAAERPSTRGVTTTPPNTCEAGVGVGATTYAIPIPMPALRQS